MKLKIILFLFIATLINAQPFRNNLPPTTASIPDINIGAVEQGDTVQNTLSVLLDKGFMPFYVSSISGVNLISNYEVLSNENLGYIASDIGDWTTNLSNDVGLDGVYGILSGGQSNINGFLPHDSLLSTSWYVNDTLNNVYVYNRVEDEFLQFALGYNTGALDIDTYLWSFDFPLYKMLGDSLNAPLYVCKRSKGGIPIYVDLTNDFTWQADLSTVPDSITSFYPQLKENYEGGLLDATAKNKDIKYKCFLWNQGEADKNFSSYYYDNLSLLIDSVRTFMNDANFPVILCGIGTNTVPWDNSVENAKRQLANEDANIYYIDADPFYPDKIVLGDMETDVTSYFTAKNCTLSMVGSDTAITGSQSVMLTSTASNSGIGKNDIMEVDSVYNIHLKVKIISGATPSTLLRLFTANATGASATTLYTITSNVVTDSVYEVNYLHTCLTGQTSVYVYYAGNPSQMVVDEFTVRDVRTDFVDPPSYYHYDQDIATKMANAVYDVIKPLFVSDTVKAVGDSLFIHTPNNGLIKIQVSDTINQYYEFKFEYKKNDTTGTKYDIYLNDRFQDSTEISNDTLQSIIVGFCGKGTDEIKIIPREQYVGQFAPSLTYNVYRKKIVQGIASNFPIITDISSVGVIADVGTAHTSLGDFDFTVSGEVIPSSNVLQPPSSLDAVLASNSINVSWTDPNISDTIISVDYTFDQEFDQYLNFHASSGTIITNSADKLKLTRNSSTNTWQNAHKSFTTYNSYTEFSFDAFVETSASVWMVVYGYDDLGLHVISNQSSATDTTFFFNVNCSLYDSLKVWVQCNTTADAQYAYFDNFLVRTTTPSYDNWVLAKLDWYLGSTIGEWDILSIGKSGTSYQHLGLTNGSKYSYKVAFVLDEDTTAWSNVDTCTYKIPPSVPTIADYHVGDETFSGSFLAQDTMAFSHFYSNFADSLAIGDVVDFVNGSVFQWRFSLGTSDATAFDFTGLPDSVSFITGEGTKPKFTGIDTLYGWSDLDHWVYDTSVNPDTNGIYPWRYRYDTYYSGTDSASLYSIGLTYVALDSVMKPFWLSKTWTTDPNGNPSHYELAVDSSYYYPSSDYPYSTKIYSGTLNNAIYVYTGSATLKPPEVYSSLTTAGASRILAKFDGTNALTIDGLVFEGGDYETIYINNCDNLTFKNSEVHKFNYRGMDIYNSANVLVDSCLFNSDYDLFQGGRIYYETFWFQGAIQAMAGTSNLWITNSTFLNSTSSAFHAYPEVNAAHGLYFKNNIVKQSRPYLLPYFRFFDFGNPTSTTVESQMPTNIYILNNIFKNGTIENKIACKDIVFAFNVIDSAYTTNEYCWDHSIYHTRSVQPLFSLTQNAYFPNSNPWTTKKYWFNNTIMDIDASFYEYMSLQVKSQYWNVWNNALINVSKLTSAEYPSGNDDNYGSRHIEFSIADISIGTDGSGVGVWNVQNNYIYSDYTTTGENTVIYGDIGSSFIPSYTTWSSINGSTASGFTILNNTKDESSSAVADILNRDNNYAPTSLLQGVGLPSTIIETILGANFTDRWGNQVTNSSGNLIDGTINIGANNTK